MARSVPYNQEAEQSLLSTMFLSKNALDKALDKINSEDFYFPNNQIIFNAISSLNKKNVPIDTISIVNELTEKDKMKDAGGLEYIKTVLTCESVAANVDYYIKLVKDKALLRKLINTAEEIQKNAYDSTDDVQDLLDSAERKIRDVVQNNKSSDIVEFRQVLKETSDNLKYLSELRGDVTGVPSGFVDIDKVTSGFHENQLIIVAARPAMGKTVFALNVAQYVGMHSDKYVAVFNLEMDAVQLCKRILSSVGQVQGHKFNSGQFNNDDWARINEAMSQLQDANIVISDSTSATIGEIRSKCRRLAASEKGLELVIIDYLQLISGGKNYGTNRQQEVSDISRALKQLAMELHVPIIALSQLSRGVEQREDKRPLMSDLRESGSLEQDADIVAFLYRDSYYKRGDNEGNENQAEFIMAKHRNGSIGTINLIFKGDTSTFRNYQKEESGD